MINPLPEIMALNSAINTTEEAGANASVLWREMEAVVDKATDELLALMNVNHGDLALMEELGKTFDAVRIMAA